jgi:hypothetical protein
MVSHGIICMVCHGLITVQFLEEEGYLLTTLCERTCWPSSPGQSLCAEDEMVKQEHQSPKGLAIAITFLWCKQLFRYLATCHILLLLSCRYGRSQFRKLIIVLAAFSEQAFTFRTPNFTHCYNTTELPTPPSAQKLYRVGQNHLYTVYTRYFWQGNH